MIRKLLKISLIKKDYNSQKTYNYIRIIKFMKFHFKFLRDIKSILDFIIL